MKPKKKQMKLINWILAFLWVIVFVLLIAQPEWIVSRLEERAHREYFERAAKELNLPVKRARRLLPGVEKPQMAELIKRVREYRQDKNKTIRFVLFGFISSLIGLGFVLNRAYSLKRKHHQALAQQHELITEQRNQLFQAVEELQRSKNQIRQSEQFLREVMDSAYDATLLFAVDGRVLDVSRKTARLFRTDSEAAFESLSFVDFIPGCEADEEADQTFENVLNGEVVFFDCEVKRPDGTTFDAEIYMKRIDHAGAELVLVNMRDVSIRKIMEDELRSSRKQLQEANLAKDKLFSIIAHDLKNPFHSIMAFSEVLMKFGPRYSAEKVARFHENIYNSSRQTYGLLENLLDWSRTQMGRIHCQPRKVNLMDTAEEILMLYADQAEKKQVRLLNTIDPHHCAMVDPDMLRTILRNLVGNAVKYTEDGQIEMESRLNQEMIELIVRDNGVGMPVEKVSRLFQVKEQVSTQGTRNEPGTGLGLVLSREFALKNGGDISVTSSPGKGCEFVLTMQSAAGVEVLCERKRISSNRNLTVQSTLHAG
jgi:PAS domain S-box-containing protein